MIRMAGWLPPIPGMTPYEYLECLYELVVNP